jgi:hypothetical protein
MNIITSVRIIIRPSNSDSTKALVSTRWISSIELVRDTTSPRWRFWKYSSGSRNRWVKMLAFHCTRMEVLMVSSIQERRMPTPCWMNSSSRKPMASVASRLVSRETTTWSTIHCMNSGPVSTKICSTSDSVSTLASAGQKPVTCPISWPSEIGVDSLRGWKPGSGQSSSATPVKCCDTSCMS